MPKYRLSEFWLEMNETETLKDFSANSDAQALWVAKEFIKKKIRDSYSWSAGDLTLHLKKYNPQTKRYRRIYTLGAGDGQIDILDERKGSR